MSTPRNAAEERSIDRSSTHQPPTYRDSQFHSLMKALRADVRPFPRAKLSLERVEARLRYILRVLDTWDRTHAGRARTLIALGQNEAADGAAWLIFDADLRRELLRQCPIGADDQAIERMVESALLGREVL